MTKILKELESDTIIEAIFELRFTSKVPAVANILLGLLFQEFRADYPKIERLLGAELPQQIIDTDPKLHHALHYKLIGDPFTIQIGEHVCSISCPRHYVGWSKFQPKIIELLKFLEDSKLIEAPERFSVKYVNVVPTNEGALKGFKLSISTEAFDLDERPLNLRTEIKEDDFINLVQISTRVTAKVEGGEEIQGALFEIDTIYLGGFTNFWDEITDLLKRAHTIEKGIFTSFLDKDTLNNLGPVWEELPSDVN